MFKGSEVDLELKCFHEIAHLMCATSCNFASCIVILPKHTMTIQEHISVKFSPPVQVIVSAQFLSILR